MPLFKNPFSQPRRRTRQPFTPVYLPNPRPDGTVELTVAGEDYPAGHRFEGGFAVGHQIVPLADAPKDAILSVNDLKDRELDVPVHRYEVFRWSHLKLI